MSVLFHDDLLRENQELRRYVGELETRVEALEQQLEKAQRTGKRQASPFSRNQTKKNPKKPGRKSGAQHGKHGHRAEPKQIDERYDAPLPEHCPHCGGRCLDEHDVIPQYQTEIPRRPIYRQFDVHVGHCQECGKRVQGRHELQTSDALGAAASQLGPEAQAAVVELNKEVGLSHGKVSGVLDELFGIELSRGGSAQVMLRVADRLTSDYASIRFHVAEREERLWLDETGWRIGGRLAWLHAWVGLEATCYHVDPHRSADALEELLSLDWEGTLHHDGFSSYDRFVEAWHQQCCQHPKRRAENLLKTAVGGAVHFPRQVIALFRESMAAHRDYRAGGLGFDELFALRDHFELRLLKMLNVDRAPPEYQRLSDHLYKHFSEWFVFLTDPECEPTNNRAERAIRPAVVNRKVWGGNRTHRGARAQSILMSVLRTCRQQGKSVLDHVSRRLCGATLPLIGERPAA